MEPVLVFMIQWGGERYHPGPVNLLDPLLLLGVGTRQAAASAELRSRAMMSELCPHGWRAQITLSSTRTPTVPRGDGVRSPDR